MYIYMHAYIHIYIYMFYIALYCKAIWNAMVNNSYKANALSVSSIEVFRLVHHLQTPVLSFSSG